MSDAPPIPVLGAPTAAGKSIVALDLARRFGLEIVSADAMQVYRGMDIGTAKPSPEERARVPHHLVDVVDPGERFSVADWARRAEEAIGSILERDRLPFVVGGTGFYIRALSRGLPTVPPADADAQEPLWERFRAEGIAPLERELRHAAPADAARAQRNPRRVIRALEVLQRTGAPPSEFPYTKPRFRFEKLVLIPGMDVLLPRIEARTRGMFAAGLVDEVRDLLETSPELGTAMQAIGYKEVVGHLRGEATLAEARAAVTLATAQYAKRQRTWFRKEPDAAQRAALATELRDELNAWLTDWPANAGRFEA